MVSLWLVPGLRLVKVQKSVSVDALSINCYLGSVHVIAYGQATTSYLIYARPVFTCRFS